MTDIKWSKLFTDTKKVMVLQHDRTTYATDRHVVWNLSALARYAHGSDTSAVTIPEEGVYSVSARGLKLVGPSAISASGLYALFLSLTSGLDFSRQLCRTPWSVDIGDTRYRAFLHSHNVTVHLVNDAFAAGIPRLSMPSLWLAGTGFDNADNQVHAMSLCVFPGDIPTPLCTVQLLRDEFGNFPRSLGIALALTDSETGVGSEQLSKAHAEEFGSTIR